MRQSSTSEPPRPAITVFGEVLWDRFEDGDQFGGAPANYAAHAAALGADVAIVTAVGDDELGRRALGRLRELRIDTRYVQVSPEHPTGTVDVTLDAGGSPRFEIAEPSAWDDIRDRPEIAARVAGSDAVYFGTLAQRSAVSRQTIRTRVGAAPAGCRRVLDINLRPPWTDAATVRRSLELATVLKLSEEELPAVLAARGLGAGADAGGDAVARLDRLRRSLDLELVALSRGGRGALLVTASGASDAPAPAVGVVDTVGAGDAFTAALTTGLLAGGALDATNRHACAVAAFVCSQRGAVPRLPQRLAGARA